MSKAFVVAITALIAGTTSLTPFAAARATEQVSLLQATPPDGQGSYEELVTLFTAFNEWKTPKAIDGIVNYSPAAVEKRRAELKAFQAKLADFAVARWDRHKQVDYLAVRAQMDLADFTLNVTKPWARDPGMYVDELQRLAYTDVPLKGEALKSFRARLRTIPGYLAQARINLDSVAADYADLAIHSLSHGYGVGHGMPCRPVEPEGQIGWYADLHARAAKQQPALVPDIEAAEQAIISFRDWLVSAR